MIRRAGKQDENIVTEYLLKEGSFNTVLLSNIEKYGFEKDFQEIWIYTGERTHEPLAVIMRYFNYLYVYSEGSFFEESELGSFAEFIGSDIISGNTSVISKMAAQLKNMIPEQSSHMVLNDTDFLIPCNMTERAKLSDCPELAGLIYSIPEFARFYHSRSEIEKGIRRRMETGLCRYFVIRKNGRIASQAYTTVESKSFATIGGVVTRPEYRKQGLASLVVSRICMDIMKDGKVPNLFYSSAEAGRVYERLGFRYAGDYSVLLHPKYIKSNNI